jgi:DNA-binding CsgD family transcriptional regulator
MSMPRSLPRNRILREQILAVRRAALSQNRPFALSVREVQVLEAYIEHYTQEEVADLLCLSPKTVSTYCTRILDKMGAKNMLHAALTYDRLQRSPRQDPRAEAWAQLAGERWRE